MKTEPTGDIAVAGRAHWTALAAILVVALAFRLPGMATRSLWIDELFTQWFAARPFGELWRDVPTYETHPPLYYSLLKLWTYAAGGSEFGLRSLSLLFSLATVAVVGIWGGLGARGRVWRTTGLLGAALIAVNFTNIRDAQNARPYAMQAFVCTVAILAALALFDRLRRGAPAWGGAHGWAPPAVVLALSAGLGLWIHNTGFFVAAGIWTGLVIALPWMPADRRGGSLVVFVAAGLGALVIWLPYLPIFLDQSRRFSELAFWLTPRLRDLYSAWLLLLGGNWPVLVLAMASLAFGLFRLGRRHPGAAAITAVTLVLPLYALLIVSFAWKPIYIQRLFDWMVPLALLVIAFGVVTRTRRLWPRLLVGLLILAVSIATTVADHSRPIDDWKGIVAEIARNARPGDVVITVPAEGSIAVDYYAGRHAGFPPVVCVPGCYPQRSLDRVYISNLGAPVIADMDRAIVDDALARYKRVWLVQVSIALYDPKSIVRSRIAEQRRFVRYHGNALAKVELFE
jgi:mannosyltransferase